MPQFRLAVPHPYDPQEATTRLKHFLEKVVEHYGDKVSGLSQSWDGNQLNFQFSTFGIQVTGEGRVTESEVEITGNLPIAAMMFKGKIESSLREQIARALK